MGFRSKIKGWFGEQETAFNMWISLNSKIYFKYHDLILPSKNGTTQIDHLIVSRYGVFIVETKNRKGWVFGSLNSPKWKQTVFKQKFTFQNPLHQTYRQKKVLSDLLGINENLVYCIVCFTGSVKFKTPMPKNVIKGNVSGYIKAFKKEIISDEYCKSLIRIIEVQVAKSDLSSRDHIKSLRNRHSSKYNCPKCGSKLIVRINKKDGKNKKFLGCDSFPKCRFSKSI